VLWSIAVGGTEHEPTVDDYEATITLLTSALYNVAQLPNGTHAQRRAFAAFKALGRGARLARAPVIALEHAGGWVASYLDSATRERRRGFDEMATTKYREAREEEAQRQRRTGAPAGGEATTYSLARSVSPSDPAGAAVEAFDQVVKNLGWARDTDKIVFAHTHQPLEDVRVPGGTVRYWNTGSWIYEPDLSSREAYLAYLRNGWPGTAVLIDSDADQPRLLRLREHLNPLRSADRHSDGR
jgi:hypothetical protein